MLRVFVKLIYINVPLLGLEQTLVGSHYYSPRGYVYFE